MMVRSGLSIVQLFNEEKNGASFGSAKNEAYALESGLAFIPE